MISAILDQVNTLLTSIFTTVSTILS